MYQTHSSSFPLLGEVVAAPAVDVDVVAAAFDVVATACLILEPKAMLLLAVGNMFLSVFSRCHLLTAG